MVYSMPDITKLRYATTAFLARREHSCFELQQKLKRYSDDQSLIRQVIAEFTEQGLQSDQRFIESYIYSRQQRGYGLLRIKAELLAKGIDECLAERVIAASDAVDTEIIRDVYRKKYADSICEDIKEYAKRKRFLQQRGFSHEQIKEVLK